MSSTTSEVSLEKPDRGEFRDSWETPVNNNMDKIDIALGYLIDALGNASGSQSNTTALNISTLTKGSADSLKKRLDKAMSADGTPKSTPEVSYAKFDRLVGSLQGNFEALSRLGQMFYWASQGQSDSNSISQPDRLRKEIGRRGLHRRNSLLTDNLSISVAASVPTIQPSSGVVEFDIGGKIFNLRSAKAATAALAASRFSVFAYVQEGTDADKTLYSGGDGVFAKTGSPAGAWNKLTSTSNASFADSKPGDIVRLSANTSYGFDVVGDYVVMAVNAGEITLFGGLPVEESKTSVTGLSFKVMNPFAVKVGYDDVAVIGSEYNEVNASPSTVDDRAYVGEIHWDGSSVVDSFTYRSKGVYDSGWQDANAISLPSPAAITGDHRVGMGIPPFQSVSQKVSSPLKVRLLVGQKNAQGHIFDVQEKSFNSEVGGATAPSVRADGFFGYVTRKSFNLLYGAKLPVGAGYGYQRKADISGFPNDGNLDASYVTATSGSAYRIIIERD